MALRIRQVTRPLTALTEQARDIARLRFRRTLIQTGDETETLAGSLNEMSDSRQAAHAELRERGRSMEELLSNVSHEVKTPMALIKAYAAGIKDGLDDGTFLDVILEQNDKVDQMVGTLLNLSRIRRNALHKGAFSLSALVRELQGEASAMLPREREPFRGRVEDGLTVEADEKQIRSALLNLMTNAAKYSASDVEVVLERGDGFPRFIISNDLQTGVCPDLSRLWEPFYVAESSRNKALSGTGLGLSIVRAAPQVAVHRQRNPRSAFFFGSFFLQEKKKEKPKRPQPPMAKSAAPVCHSAQSEENHLRPKMILRLRAG